MFLLLIAAVAEKAKSPTSNSCILKNDINVHFVMKSPQKI